MIRKIFILICCAVISCLLFFCSKQDSIETIITKVDIEEMARRHLTDFNLLREHPKHIYGKEFVFDRESDSVNVFLKIGLHRSPKDASNIPDNYFNEISAVMNEGPHQGLSVGEKFWWLAPGQESNNVMNIVFIRKNALFIMSCDYNYGELMTLAKKIDDDILNSVDYVKLENTILLPVVDSITASKTVLKEGEMTEITVHASDPNNEPLEYDAIGLSHYESDPENVFTEIATRDYIEEPFWGSHIYKFKVVNENNIVSKVAEFEIIISQ